MNCIWHLAGVGIEMKRTGHAGGPGGNTLIAQTRVRQTTASNGLGLFAAFPDGL